MARAEGICSRNGHYGYISNEKVSPVTQKLRWFDIRPFVSNIPVTYIFNGNGNWENASNWSEGNMPPATLTSATLIFIDPSGAGSCILNIPYTVPAGSSIMVSEGKQFLVQGNLIVE